MSDAGLRMALKGYIDSQLPSRKNNTAVQGVVSGGRVTIGGRRYYYDAAVDIQYDEGETVWCVLSDNAQTAVIVGK